ncbi:MAG: hypothetical protein JWM11_2774 [Planctomycetaceae bacterium]|nr:hypothetical protein [Planctomycetaceae bacterium]
MFDVRKVYDVASMSIDCDLSSYAPREQKFDRVDQCRKLLIAGREQYKTRDAVVLRDCFAGRRML